MYNTGLFLSKAYNFLGSISIGTLRRWIQAYRKHENADCLTPKYKSTRQGEYNTILDSEMKNLLTLLLHPSQYKIGKAIKLTKGKTNPLSQFLVQIMKRMANKVQIQKIEIGLLNILEVTNIKIYVEIKNETNIY